MIEFAKVTVLCLFFLHLFRNYGDVSVMYELTGILVRMQMIFILHAITVHSNILFTIILFTF